MQYEYARDKTSDGEPSLQEMTIKAIEILRRNTNGYFLLVEGKFVVKISYFPWYLLVSTFKNYIDIL